jgi:hypothetical protein
MLNLRNVTLVAMTTRDYAATHRAITKCLTAARFHSVMVFTDKPNSFFGFDTIPIPKIETWEQSSVIGLTTVTSYVKEFSDYTLGIHWDGFIVNPDAWSDEFFDYDFIGAPWKTGLVGNNGFCLSSRKWYEGIQNLNLAPTIDDCHPADAVVCRYHRESMLEYGIRYAPTEVARRFSVENEAYDGSFGFHGKETLADLYRQHLI